MLQAAEYDAVVSITHGDAAVQGGRARRGGRPARRRRRPGRARRPRRPLPEHPRRAPTTCCAPSSRPCPTARPSRTASRSARRPRRSCSRCARPTAPPPRPRRSPPGTQPGDYRPTPPKLAAPMYTELGLGHAVRADAAAASSARPRTPRSTARRTRRRSPRCESLGRDSSTTRTAGPDRGRQVLERLADLEHLEPGRPAARRVTAQPRRDDAAFAAMDLALADTTIALYDAKYADHVWRPVTAIRAGVPARGRPQLEPAHAHRRRPVLPRRAQRAERRRGDRAGRPSGVTGRAWPSPRRPTRA